MKRCENCRWWTDAKLSAQMQDIEVDSNGYVSGATHKDLGYCEPPARDSGPWVAGHVPPMPPVNHGLTASDHSCGEHTSKEPTP